MVDAHFEGKELRRDLNRLRAKWPFKIERVGEAVGWIGTHDECTQPHIGSTQRGSSGDAGLSNATFTREDEGSHGCLSRSGALSAR